MILSADQSPSVAALIAALSEFPPDAPCGIAALQVEGVVAEIQGHSLGGVDCCLDADGRVTTVWLLTDAPSMSAPPGANWSCPSCGSHRYVCDGDEIPWCCT
jgi:hypothetical protein